MKTTTIKLHTETRIQRIKAEPSEGRDLNRIVASHSAFANFADLVNARGGYRPSIYVGGKTKQAKRELVYLTLEYNRFQAARGDSRRVYCGDFELVGGAN